MAHCLKCGNRKVKKRRDGLRKCKRCGTLPNGKGLNRSGQPSEMTNERSA